MRFSAALKIGTVIGALCVCTLARAQDTPPPPTPAAPVRDVQVKKEGIPARAAAGDYQAHAQAGTVTVAAEFRGHAIPTADLLLNSEDYVTVEVAFFGPPDARLKLSIEDFSLRINGKKATLPNQSDLMVFKSVKDPEWEPEVKAEKANKTSIGNGGGGRGGQADQGGPPPVVHPPIALQRDWEHRVEKASLLEGERALPQAGFIFFKYGGKTKNLKSIELIYDGPAGKATLSLEPE
jgi:hypothetical protein